MWSFLLIQSDVAFYHELYCIVQYCRQFVRQYGIVFHYMDKGACPTDWTRGKNLVLNNLVYVCLWLRDIAIRGLPSWLHRVVKGKHELILLALLKTHAHDMCTFLAKCFCQFYIYTFYKHPIYKLAYSTFRLTVNFCNDTFNRQILYLNIL